MKVLDLQALVETSCNRPTGINEEVYCDGVGRALFCFVGRFTNAHRHTNFRSLWGTCR